MRWQSSEATFVASEWALGGCATLYQQPEEGRGERRSVITAQRFPLMFFLSSPSKQNRAGGFVISDDIMQADAFFSKANSLTSPKGWSGGRASVCRGLPCLWFTLYSECVSVGDWTPTLPWNGLFTAAVNPFHSSSCSVRDKAPGSPFAAFKWCSAKASHECPDMTAQESDLQAQYLPEFTFSYHPPRRPSEHKDSGKSTSVNNFTMLYIIKALETERFID